MTHRRLWWLWLPLLTGACSEYEFKASDDINDADDTSERDDQETGSPPQGDDCLDQIIEGYATSTDADCENEVETGTFNPEVEWSKESWTAFGGANQVMSQPIVVQVTDDDGDGDIDDDDTPDIVLVTFEEASWSSGGVLRAVSGADGSEIFDVGGTGVQATGGVAAGDIDGDGYVELVSITSSTVMAFEHDGTTKWTSSNISSSIYGISDVPAISDMDGDGSPEIIAGSAILNSNGVVVGQGNFGIGGVNGNNVGSCSFAVDVDGDGVQEVVVGNALYEKDGTTIWFNGENDGYPAVADFDGDGQAEIVVSASSTIRLQDTDGTVLWVTSIPGASGSYYGGPPTVADFDGDGLPEIGVAVGSSYTVLNDDGSVLWQVTTDDSSSGNTGSAVFDFEGDGVAEVVYADQSSLWVFSGADGSVKLQTNEHSNGTWMEYPTIADVDGDDHAEIVVPRTSYGSPAFSGIAVFGDADNSWRPGRTIWNQHAYHITNVEDNGEIPSVADQNWQTFNNFRSGDMTAGDGTSAPDLTLAMADICEIDCDEDRLILWLHAGNEGAVDLDIESELLVYARTGGTDSLLDAMVIDPSLYTGAYADSIQVELKMSDVGAADSIVFVISSQELECDETNNELVWDGPFCE